MAENSKVRRRSLDTVKRSSNVRVCDVVTSGKWFVSAATRLPGIKGIMIKVFKQNDTSGDGALSREELAARAEVRFTQLDTNADGYLDTTEIKAGRRTR